MQKTASQIGTEVLQKLALSSALRGAAALQGSLRAMKPGATPRELTHGIRNMGKTQPKTLSSLGLHGEAGAVTPSTVKGVAQQHTSSPAYAEDHRVMSHFSVPETAAMMQDNPHMKSRLFG